MLLLTLGSRSLWLVPREPDARLLQQVIDELSGAFGGPSFKPHVTLCSRVGRAATGVSTGPIVVRWAELAGDDDYYHACYLPAEDGDALRALQARCAEEWRARVPPGYPPHLSLAYGSLSATQRERARRAARALPPAVTLTRWELWQTGGPVATWRRLQSGECAG